MYLWIFTGWKTCIYINSDTLYIYITFKYIYSLRGNWGEIYLFFPFTGIPPASVSWLQKGLLVDANYNVSNGVSLNSLEKRASRVDLDHAFVCTAHNNDITAPLVITYTRNVTCKFKILTFFVIIWRPFFKCFMARNHQWKDQLWICKSNQGIVFQIET